jgi:hypothetical protein
MSRDPLDERARELFAAARREPAPEVARLRIAAALRAQKHRATVADSRSSAWRGARVWLAVAAAAAVAGAILSMQVPAAPIDITAEAPAPASTQHTTDASTAPPTTFPVSPVSSAAPPVAPGPSTKRAPVRPPPSLDQELASMQRARAALGRGDASAALAELDQFGRGPGWRQLAVEARLLRIEALARAGRADEAQNLARRFVEQNPNNPLVDRARTFATPAASSGVEEPPKENHP